MTADWLWLGAYFAALMGGVGAYCFWGLRRLDAEDRAADERQRGVL